MLSLIMNHRNPIHVFVRVCTTAALLLAISVAGCTSVEQITLPLLNDVRITTTMLGGTEGIPGKEYTYTVSHTPTATDIRYEWRFDDTVVVVSRGSGSMNHTFTGEGFYTVRVSVVSNEKNAVLGRGTVLVNIRAPRTIDIPMVAVQAGTFTMGSNRSFNEQPPRSVTLTRNFLISKTELIQAQWNAVMGVSPSWHTGDSLPVEMVTWYEAVDFCNRLSLRQGLTPCYTIRGDTVTCLFSANGYRLPTEAEWEFAARAGETRDYYGGTVEQPFAECTESDSLDTDLAAIAWYCKNGDERTHRTGLLKPNALGLYDMLGNVSEWVWDVYDGAYYSSAPTINPTGPDAGVLRSARGGSFLVGAFKVRLSCRLSHNAAKLREYDTGFRLVRTAN